MKCSKCNRNIEPLVQPMFGDTHGGYYCEDCWREKIGNPSFSTTYLQMKPPERRVMKCSKCDQNIEPLVQPMFGDVHGGYYCEDCWREKIGNPSFSTTYLQSKRQMKPPERIVVACEECEDGDGEYVALSDPVAFPADGEHHKLNDAVGLSLVDYVRADLYDSLLRKVEES